MHYYKAKHITEISPEFLKSRNIEFLIVDLDNTLGSYAEPLPSKEVVAWVKELERNGVRMFIASNNHKEDRVRAYAECLGTGYRCRCCKPLTSSLRSILWENGYFDQRECVAIIGDQVFTDMFAGRACKLNTVLVEPLKLSSPLMFVRYILEIPFRIYRKKVS